MIEFSIRGEEEIVAKVSSLADTIAAEMIRAMNGVNLQLQRHIVRDKLSGQVLKSHTGNLKRAIVQIPAEREGGDLFGSVALGSEARYGLAHEFGAHIPERHPVNAKALHWVGRDGGEVFAMRAAGFDLPQRSFMRSSFSEFRERIEGELRAAVEKAAA